MPLAQNVNSLLLEDNKFKRENLLTVNLILASPLQWNGGEGRHGLRQGIFSYLYLTGFAQNRCDQVEPKTYLPSFPITVS